MFNPKNLRRALLYLQISGAACYVAVQVYQLGRILNLW